MFCPNCGAKNRDGAKFCTSCASRLAEPPPASIPGGEGGPTQLYPPGYLSGAGGQQAPGYREPAQYAAQNPQSYAPPAGQQYPYDASNQQSQPSQWGAPAAAPVPYQQGYAGVPATPQYGMYPATASPGGFGLTLKQIAGLLGAIIFAVGIFIPIIDVVGVTAKYYDDGNRGKTTLVLVAVAAVFALATGVRGRRWIMIAGWVMSTLSIAIAAILVAVTIHDLYNDGAQSFISWPGFVVMFFGALLVLVAPLLPAPGGSR